MKFRWVLALLVGAMLVGPFTPTRAQQQFTSGPIHLLEQTQNGITVEFSALFQDFQQTADYAELLSPTQSDSTRQARLPGNSVFPVYAALVGLPPSGSVELRVLIDDALPVTDTRLLTAASAADRAQTGAVRLTDEAWVRDQRVARLEYRPFQVQSGGAAGQWHQHVRVALRFSTVPAAAPAFAAQPAEAAALAGQLLNADQARAWRAAALPSGLIRDPFADAPNTPTGPRFKIVVDQDGLYQVTAADLLSTGFDLTGVDPRNLQLTSQGLVIPIRFQGESDGSFDTDDLLIFYGQKFRGDRLAARHPEESSYYSFFSNGWQPQFNGTQAEKYTAENVYWLTLENTPGLRISERAAAPTGAAAGTHTRETVHFEGSVFWWTWHYTGEDTWFWGRFRDQLDHTFSLILPDAAATSADGVQIRGDLVARVSNLAANPDHHTQIYLNSTLVEDVKWDGPTRHRFTGTLPQSALAPTGANVLHVKTLWDAYPGQVTDDIYLDWVEVDYDRNLAAANEALAFRAAAPVQRYQLGSFTSPQVELWDISQPTLPVRLTGFTNTAGTLDFEAPLSTTANFIAAGTSAWQMPKRVEYYIPPDLTSAAPGADYIIITHFNFIATAQRLADLRTAQGLRVLVVDFNDLVNQFNDGIYHPIAIKNFLAYTFLHYQAPAPAFAVLIGDGHWNLRGFNTAQYGTGVSYLPPNLAWVDYPDITSTNQGEIESTNLLANVVGLDPLPDLSIGRIPVNSTAELNAVIDKIQNYEQAAAHQDWQKNFLFIADDVPDPAGDFQVISDDIAADYVKVPYQALKAYLAGTSAADLTAQTDAIVNQLNVSGALVASYVGHGSAGLWGSSGAGTMFNTATISRLANGDRLPIILSMTCSDGYWILPPNVPGFPSSLAEELLRAPNKGAIATFSPSGYDDVYGHDKLQRGFMTSLMKYHVTNIGALTTAARLRVYTGGTNLELIHQFILFGDPALRLKLPLNSTYLPVFRR